MNETANSVMITLARESRGISQKALAEHLGVSQAAVSKLESGQIKAEGELLSKLTDVNTLNYPASFFCRQFEIYPPGLHFYRKHKTLPAKIAKRIEAALNIRRLHVGELLQSCDIDFTPVRECDIEEYGSAREVARAVRQYLHLPRGPIKSMAEVLESAGIVVIPFNPGSRLFSGASMIVNTETSIIIINSEMPTDRFRWTLAHELAHIVMHRLPSGSMEHEADEFAGELLMPSDEIVPHLDGLTVEKLSALKRYWKVSINAIVTNAHKMGALLDWQARMIRVNLAEHGITRTHEPKELELAKEQPALLSELIDFHLNDLAYSVEELSDKLGLYASEFLSIYKPILSRITAVPRQRLSLVRG